MNRTRLFMLTGIALVLIVCVSGCVRRRTVLIPPGEPVQLAEPVEAHVYVSVEGERQRSENRVTLPEGWWCLPDPD